MYVYKITNIINGKVLIGQTIQRNVNVRWSDYRAKLKKNKHENSHFQHSWNKYGEQNFKWEVIDTANSLEELNQLETKHIQLYDSLNPTRGYNKLPGGNNRTMSNETKEKLRQIAILRFAAGWRHPLLGKSCSLETRRKIGDSLRGRKCPKTPKM